MLEQFIRDCLFGLFGFVIIVWDPYSSVWWLLRVSVEEGKGEKSGEESEAVTHTQGFRKNNERKLVPS